MSQPRQLDNPLYVLIRNEQISAFNAQKPKDTVVDLSDGDFRGIDLRALDAQDINFTTPTFAALTCAALTCATPSSKAPAWPMRRFPAPTSRSN